MAATSGIQVSFNTCTGLFTARVLKRLLVTSLCMVVLIPRALGCLCIMWTCCMHSNRGSQDLLQEPSLPAEQ